MVPSREVKSPCLSRELILFVMAALALLLAGNAAADPLFQDPSTLKVEISAPLSTLVRNRPEEEELPGTFSYTAEDGTRVEASVSLPPCRSFLAFSSSFLMIFRFSWLYALYTAPGMSAGRSDGAFGRILVPVRSTGYRYPLLSCL